jgi:hypothetical protein
MIFCIIENICVLVLVSKKISSTRQFVAVVDIFFIVTFLYYRRKIGKIAIANFYRTFNYYVNMYLHKIATYICVLFLILSIVF